jgi:acetyltransferase-like isoleucine patch superfamily enzyme
LRFGNDLKIRFDKPQNNIIAFGIKKVRYFKDELKKFYYKNKFNLGKNVQIGDRCDFRNPKCITIGKDTFIGDDCILH